MAAFSSISRLSASSHLVSSPTSVAALSGTSRLAADILRVSGQPLLATSVQTAADVADLASLAADLLKASAVSGGGGPAEGASGAYFTFSEFAALVRAAAASTRSLPVTHLDSYEKPSDTGPLRIGHQYVVATVLHPRGPTYARFDMFLASDAPGIVFEGPCLLRVKMSDDKHALSKGRRLLSSVATRAGQPVTSAPSLDALAALVDTIAQRAGRTFGVLGRNCAWMNELLMFGTARKFSAHWLGGEYFPQETMRRWMQGEIGVLTATTDCTHPDPVGRWLARTSGTAVRGLHMLFAQNSESPLMMQDDEVREVVDAWTGYLPARV